MPTMEKIALKPKISDFVEGSEGEDEGDAEDGDLIETQTARDETSIFGQCDAGSLTGFDPNGLLTSFPFRGHLD